MDTINDFYERLSSRRLGSGLSMWRYLKLSVLTLLVIGVQSCSAATPAGPAAAPTSDTATPNRYVASPTRWGFTPFPYDFTQEAIEKTYNIVNEHSTLFAIHRGDGIPWQEAYDDTEFPEKVRKHWDEHLKRLPKGKKIYLGLAPLDTDRKSLAAISKGSKTSGSFLKKNLDSPEVMQAYLNYVRRAVKMFNPDYLNIGIEVGELADRSKSRWDDFEVLFEHVRSRIKREYPDILIGISFGLPSLMKPEVAQRAQKIVASSDYIGISFYPYFSSYKNDAASQPPQQWLEPLNWLRNYAADKPIAIAETGYATKDATLASPRLHMKGNPQWQKDYLTDLAAIAERDGYLFVAWFLAIDHEALSRRAGYSDGDAARLWENIGLFDANLRPKPAWETWQQILRGEIAASVPPASTRAVTVASPEPSRTPAAAAGSFSFGFDDASQLFDGSKHDKVSLSNQSPVESGKSQQWTYDYEKGRFQWASRVIQPGALSGGIGMELRAKATQGTYVLIAFEEKSGESFYTVLEVSEDWKSTSVSFSDLKRDEKKKKEDGRFQPEKVVSVTIADARAFQGARGSQTVWLANWQVVTATVDTTGAARFNFGFDDASQLFDGSKHDKISLSNQLPEGSGSGKSLQWAYKYKSGRFQWAFKPVNSGAMAGGTEMELWTKAKQSTYVLVSFEEKSGESFFTVLEVSDDWKSTRVSFSDLQRDEKKKKEDGQFQPEKVVSVTIADARAFQGARGSQTVWLANWQVR